MDRRQNRSSGRRNKLAAALAAGAGLLAFAVPAAAQAAPLSSAKVTAQVVPGNVNLNGNQGVFHLNAPYSDCTFVVGDRYHAAGGAIGEADLICSRKHIVRIKVSLDYLTVSGTEHAYRWNTAGVAGYGKRWDAWTGCAADLTAYWTTYARVSIDGSPYSGLFSSRKNVAYAARAC